MHEFVLLIIVLARKKKVIVLAFSIREPFCFFFWDSPCRGMGKSMHRSLSLKIQNQIIKDAYFEAPKINGKIGVSPLFEQSRTRAFLVRSNSGWLLKAQLEM